MTDKPVHSVLGRARKIYRGRAVNGRDFFLWVLPGVLIPLGCLGYGTLILVMNPAQGAAARTWFVLAAVSLAPFAILSVRRFFTSRQAVILHENGLRFRRLRTPVHSLGWSQVRAIRVFGTAYHFFGLPVSQQLRLAIQPEGSREIILPAHLQGLPDLAESIRQAVYPLVRPELETALRAGQSVRLGPVEFDKRALAFPNRRFDWDAVRRLQVERGALVVETGEKVHRFPAGEIPNLELLLQLVAQEIDGKPASAPANQTEIQG